MGTAPVDPGQKSGMQNFYGLWGGKCARPWPIDPKSETSKAITVQRPSLESSIFTMDSPLFIVEERTEHSRKTKKNRRFSVKVSKDPCASDRMLPIALGS